MRQTEVRKFMRNRCKLILTTLFSTLLCTPVAATADDLNSVLAKLNEASTKFHSTSAEFVFDTEQIDPVPDTDIQKGIVYYERTGKSFQMTAHIREHNKRPTREGYAYAGGILRSFDGNQMHVYQAAKWESYLMLGFGASGTELTDKWNVKYLGAGMIDGKKVQQLELVAKDPEVRKTITKITIWVDAERGVSLQQRFDEGPSMYRVCKYSNIKVNQSLPSNAFDLKADMSSSRSSAGR